MKKSTYLSLLGFIMLLPLLVLGQRAGDLDRSFNYGLGENYQFNRGNGADYDVYQTVIQPDGKIIIVGTFTIYNGIIKNRIARLNTDGTIDSSFNTGNAQNYPIFAVALQSDGKILVGGSLTSFNNVPVNRITRLNNNGSLDTSFHPGTGVGGISSYLYNINIQPDGKIIIAGSFSSYNGNARNCIARLNTDGSLDTNFIIGSGLNGNVRTTAIQSDGKIIIGGEFTSFNRVSRNNIVRLNANGTLDNSFDPGTGTNDLVNSLISLPDGKIIIGGEFTTYNNLDKRYLARLNSNGILDESFNRINGPNSSITAAALQANGNILIAGEFGSSFNTSTARIAQLNPNGSFNRTLNLGIGPTGEYPIILNIALQGDGKIILVGRFTSYDRVAKHKIARLNANGSLDLSFNPAVGIGADIPEIYSKAIQPDGKIIIAGNFNSYNGIARNRIARLNPDGGLDTSFNPGAFLLPGFNNINAIVLQPNGKILIGGGLVLLNRTGKDIIRLNENGSLDSSFSSLLNPSSYIRSISIQNNGKIVVGGQLRMINRTASQYVARINADGSIFDSSDLSVSQAPIFSGTQYYLKSTLQLDGRIIIWGAFTSYNGVARNNIARLNTDGSIDTSFNSLGINGLIDDVILQPDGKVLIRGNISYLGGDYRNQIVRLNSNGSLDPSFVPETNSIYSVYSAALQPDGKILLGVFFNTYNPGTRDNLIRLNANGRLDGDFNYGVGPNKLIRLITLQPDGRIIIAGDFTGYNGFSTPYIARIHGLTVTSTKKSINAPKLKLYPNPTTGIVNLTTSPDAESIIIINSVGQIVYTAKAQPQMELNLSSLASGVYMVQVQSSKGLTTQRLVIQ